MERFAHFERELLPYIGMQTSKEALLGRNYFHVIDGKVADDLNLSALKDLGMRDKTDYSEYYKNYKYQNSEDEDLDEDTDEEDDEITCKQVKAYLAQQTTSDGWFKCLPTHPDDIEVGSAYIIIRIQVDHNFVVTKIHVFTRYIEDTGMHSFYYIPQKESIESYTSHMPMFPPEVLTEIEMLKQNRYYKDGMSLIGKPLPSEIMWFNGCTGTKTTAKSSAFRNSYWHISIDVDDNGNMSGFDISTYFNEHTMFQRPQLSNDDIMDGLDCILTILDAYTEDEFNDFFKN